MTWNNLPLSHAYPDLRRPHQGVFAKENTPVREKTTAVRSVIEQAGGGHISQVCVPLFAGIPNGSRPRQGVVAPGDTERGGGRGRRGASL